MNSLQEINSIFGGTSLESYERGCWVGPVGGREMPWIRNQNTRCYRGSDAIKSNERVSEREAMRAVCWQAGCLPESHTEGVQDTELTDFLRSLTLRWNPSQGVCFPRGLCVQWLETRDTSWGGHEAWNPTWIQSLHPFVKRWEGGDNRFFTKLLHYLRTCMGKLITLTPGAVLLELGFRSRNSLSYVQVQNLQILCCGPLVAECINKLWYTNPREYYSLQRDEP